MKKTTKSKLAKYGAFSLAVAGAADASGQIVFTDVEPDFVGLASDNVEYFIDFDGDGTDDLRIIGGQFGGNNFTAINNDTGAVSGLTVGQPVGAYTYALNLPADTVIDASTGDFGNVGSLCYLDGFDGTFCGENGATPDGFAGIQFDINGSTHFAWVALEAVSADGFTVTGYAYESAPDTGIPAGETLSLEDNTIEGFSSFVTDNVLTLNARTPLESVTVHSISGQEIISQKLSNTTETVDLNRLSTGVYIATVSVEGKLQAIKFVK